MPSTHLSLHYHLVFGTKEEYREFLEKNDIVFDERYVW